jgi:hypothetical protein
LAIGRTQAFLILFASGVVGVVVGDSASLFGTNIQVTLLVSTSYIFTEWSRIRDSVEIVISVLVPTIYSHPSDS